MCVYSFVADRFYDKWTQPPYTIPSVPYEPKGPLLPLVPPYIPMPELPPEKFRPHRPLTQEEIDLLREWLEQARAYDKRTGQPDCENDDKIERLKKIILELKPDADLSFLDEEKK